MFQVSLTRRFWSRGERGPQAGSLALALLVHLALVALLIQGISTAPEAGEGETVWLLVGPPGPGGGVDELAAPGARAPQSDRTAEEPPAAEEEPEEESPVAEPVATPQDLVPDSIPSPTEAGAGGGAADGGDFAPGIAIGGGGGRGGGAGGGTTGGLGSGSGGRGAARPLHLVVPRIPRDVDERRARGQSVRLLLEVLPDGSVGEVRVERGSSMAALDSAAVAAARQLRYSPPTTEVGISLWTRAEMRF